MTQYETVDMKDSIFNSGGFSGVSPEFQSERRTDIEDVEPEDVEPEAVAPETPKAPAVPAAPKV